KRKLETEKPENLVVGPDLSKMSEREKKFYKLKLQFRSSAKKTKREVLYEQNRNKRNSKNISQNTPRKKRIYSLTAADAKNLYDKQDLKARRRKNNGEKDHAFSAYLRKVEVLDDGGLPIQNEKELVNAEDLSIPNKVRNDKTDVDKMVAEIEEARSKRHTFSRRRKYDEEKDIHYINRRNEAFNNKVSRAFDKYTFEIKANLERGTAL
ncbi:hypothetical protein MHBO_004240, partial [Bonamia ostreae]